MNKSKIDSLITDYLSGNCTPEEELELTSWRKMSSENERYFLQFDLTWKASIQLLNKINDGVYTKPLKKRTDETGFKKSHYRFENLQSFRLSRILKYAVIIFTSVVIGSIATYTVTDRMPTGLKPSEILVEAPGGSRSYTILPDGTQVWLNALSKLTYLSDFNNKDRVVKLEGEAFFHVATNHRKPFYVKTASLAIKATGTSFNVKAYPADEKIITTLLDGKVMIEGKDNTGQKFSVEMEPNQCATYYAKAGKLSGKNLRPDNPVKKLPYNGLTENPATKLQLVKTSLQRPEINSSWKENRWIIDNEDLNNLAIMLERRYNVKITFQSEELRQYHFTGTIRNESIEQVLGILCLAIPVKYEINKNNIYLSINKDLKKKYTDALKDFPDGN